MNTISNLLLFSIFLFELSSFACEDSTIPLEQKFNNHGLVDINTLDSTIQIRLMFASRKNMFDELMYGDLGKGYFQPEVAEKIVKAQKILQEKHPDYSIVILDAARPRSVQNKMWSYVKGTSLQPYVADPSRGSMHNYGTAVDITIADKHGNELDMGDPDPRTYILNKSREEIEWLLSVGNVTKEQAKNRKLLKEVMLEAGFTQLSHEWWHFYGLPKEEVRKRFSIIE